MVQGNPPAQFPREVQERLLQTVVGLRRDVIVLEVPLSMEGYLLLAHPAVLHIHLGAQSTNKTCTSTYVPESPALICGITNESVGHQHTIRNGYPEQPQKYLSACHACGPPRPSGQAIAVSVSVSLCLPAEINLSVKNRRPKPAVRLPW